MSSYDLAETLARREQTRDSARPRPSSAATIPPRRGAWSPSTLAAAGRPGPREGRGFVDTW